MKVLFVSCYVNNPQYIPLTKSCLDKYLIDTEYTFICLNDAPARHEDYLDICNMLTGEKNCYEQIKNVCEENNFIHIKIPQSIHTKHRANHSSARHAENLTWFNSNIDSFFPFYDEYDYLCYIDSDAFLAKPINLKKELDSYDLAGPIIHIRNVEHPFYYIHTGLFFINLKSVHNFKELNWENTMKTDTGSDIANFLKKNPNYKIKQLGIYNEYGGVHYNTENGSTIISLDIPDIPDNHSYTLIDAWFDEHFYHFRGGSCFGIGSLQHRNKDRLFLYSKKMEAFMKLLT